MRGEFSRLIRRGRGHALILLFGLCLAATSTAAAQAAAISTATAQAAAAQAAGAITVSGATLLRDGTPWVPRGVNVVGLLAPAPSPYPIFAQAQAHWGAAELTSIRAFGADTVRLQISPWGLDPQSPVYAPGYVGRVTAAVALIRQAGLAVILSMQPRGTAGIDHPADLPDASTARAWAALAPQARDPGVMLELFNEPIVKLDPPITPAKWQRMWAEWRAAFQPLVAQIRAGGAANVLVLDGAQTANFVDPAAVLADPAHRLAYAVHPYFSGASSTAAKWPANFGDMADKVPVIATEWDMDSTVACVPNGPALSAQFVAYAASHHIGVIGWAFDVPGSLVRDFSFAPTDFERFECGKQGHSGPGKLLSAAFHGGG